MIKVGDRIIAKKDSAIYKEMDVNGIEFEIVEITNSLIKVKNDLGYGIMSMDELSQFDIVNKRENKEEKEKWSKWHSCPEFQTKLYNVFYKTKGRQTHVILVFPYGETKITSSGRSFAHPDDEYSLKKGIVMAISEALKHRVNDDIQSFNRTCKVNSKLKFMATFSHPFAFERERGEK